MEKKKRGNIWLLPKELQKWKNSPEKRNFTFKNKMLGIFLQKYALKNIRLVEKFRWYYQNFEHLPHCKGTFLFNPYNDTKGFKNRMSVNTWKANNKKHETLCCFKEKQPCTRYTVLRFNNIENNKKLLFYLCHSKQSL